MFLARLVYTIHIRSIHTRSLPNKSHFNLIKQKKAPPTERKASSYNSIKCYNKGIVNSASWKYSTLENANCNQKNEKNYIQFMQANHPHPVSYWTKQTKPIHFDFVSSVARTSHILLNGKWGNWNSHNENVTIMNIWIWQFWKLKNSSLLLRCIAIQISVECEFFFWVLAVCCRCVCVL